MFKNGRCKDHKWQVVSLDSKRFSAFNNNKVQVGALSGQCETSRRLVGSSSPRWQCSVVTMAVITLSSGGHMPRLTPAGRHTDNYAVCHKPATPRRLRSYYIRSLLITWNHGLDMRRNLTVSDEWCKRIVAPKTGMRTASPYWCQGLGGDQPETWRNVDIYHVDCGVGLINIPESEYVVRFQLHNKLAILFARARPRVCGTWKANKGWRQHTQLGGRVKDNKG